MKYKLLIISILLAFSNVIFAQSEIPLQEMLADSIVKQDMAKNAEYFSKGLEEKYNENYPVAIYNFEQALLFYNDDDASMYELADLYQMVGRDTEAYSMISRAAELQPDNKWYQMRLARFCAKDGDYQSFIDIYDKLIENEPENLEYLEAYINVLLRMGDYEKVLEKLNVLEEQMGKNEYIFLQRIQIYDEQGKKDKAIEEMEKLVEFMPENTHYRALLAEAYRKMKHDKEAYKQYLKIKEIEPDNQYINISLMDYYQSMGELDKAFAEFIAAIKNKNLDYETKAQIYDFWFQKQDVKDAIDDAEAAGNAFIEMYPEKCIGYYIIGTVYFNKQDYATAKEYYQMALERESNNFSTLYQLALCCIDLNDYQGLIEISDKAKSIYPEQPLFYLFSGIGYFNLNDYENTIKILEKGRNLSANKDLTADFDTYIGDTYMLLKNNKKAFEAYERVLRAKPDNIYVLNNYAYYLSLDNHDFEKALQMSAKTIQAEPKNPTYLDTYAWILYKLDRYDEAKKYMDKVFKYDKNPQGINYEHFGDILYKMGDVKNAVKNWKKAKKAGGEVSEFLDKKIKDEKLYE
ncbi:MAG: tetratricopeptide repeat protein [Bacteroidales bacterium]|nr:tetratricopeptide repeat protein [Bacteroidales bacterium]